MRTRAPGEITPRFREKYGLTLWIILEIILFYHYLHVKMIFFNFFQIMILFIPGAANCGDRNVTLATMANEKIIKHTQCLDLYRC